MRWLPKRKRTYGYITVGLFVFYTLFGFFCIPWILTGIVLPGQSENLNGEITVENADFNPFTFRLQLDKLKIDNEQKDVLISCHQIVVNAQVESLWADAYTFYEITLDQPFVGASVSDNGVLNFDKLFKPSDEPAEEPEVDPTQPQQPLLLAIEKLAIKEGGLIYEDHSLTRPFRQEVKSLNIALDKFRTHPENENPYSFTATTDTGETLHWEGSFFLNPLTSSGKLKLSELTFGKYYAFWEPQVNFKPAGGNLSIDLSYRFSPIVKPNHLDVDIKSVNIREVALAAKDKDEPFLKSGELDLVGIEVDVLKRNVVVESLRLAQGQINVNRNGDQIDLATYLTPVQAEPAPAVVETKSSNAPPGQLETRLNQIAIDAQQPWAIRVGKVELTQQHITFADATTNPPVTTRIKDLELTTEEITSEKEFLVPLNLSMKLNDGSTFTAKGEIAPMANRLRLEVKASQLDASHYDPYLAPSGLKAKLASGLVMFDGVLEMRKYDTADPEIDFKGEAAIETFSLATDGDPVIKWDRFGVQGVEFALNPLSIKIEEVVLDKPFARSGLDENGDPLINELFVSADKPVEEETEVKKPEPSKNPTPAFPIEIGRIRIVDGNTPLIDKSQQPNVTVGLKSIEGEIRNINSKDGSHAKIEITAQFDGAAPLKITGELNPFVPTTASKIELTLNAMPLKPMSPYSGRYMGYVIDKGSLSMTLKYTIDQYKLDGSNVVLFDQFFLGDRTDSKEAMKLPVKLALKLVRDRNGQINITLPVSGKLDDPKFTYGHLVWQVIFNTLTKVAAAPFDFIAGSFGGKGQDLSHVRFTAASVELTPKAMKKLDILIKALDERPALELQIVGSVDAKVDVETMQKTMLVEQIKSELAADNEQSPDEPVESSDEIYKEAIAQRFIALHPELGFEIAPDEPVKEDTAKPRVRTGRRRGVIRRRPTQKKDDAARPVNPDGEEGEIKLPPFEKMEAEIVAAIEITDDQLTNLANDRAAAVRAYLIRTIKEGRVQVQAVESARKDSKGSKAEFKLQ